MSRTGVALFLYSLLAGALLLGFVRFGAPAGYSLPPGHPAPGWAMVAGWLLWLGGAYLLGWARGRRS